MADGKGGFDDIRPQTVKMSDSTVAKLRKLPRFQGMTYSDIIRSLVDDAINGKFDFSRDMPSSGISGEIENYRQANFSGMLTSSSLLILKLPNLSRFWHTHMHEAFFQMRLERDYPTRIILKHGEENARDNPFTSAVLTEIRRITSDSTKWFVGETQERFPTLSICQESHAFSLPHFAILNDYEGHFGIFENDSVAISCTHGPSGYSARDSLEAHLFHLYLTTTPMLRISRILTGEGEPT